MLDMLAALLDLDWALFSAPVVGPELDPCLLPRWFVRHESSTSIDDPLWPPRITSAVTSNEDLPVSPHSSSPPPSIWHPPRPLVLDTVPVCGIPTLKLGPGGKNVGSRISVPPCGTEWDADLSSDPDLKISRSRNSPGGAAGLGFGSSLFSPPDLLFLLRAGRLRSGEGWRRWVTPSS